MNTSSYSVVVDNVSKRFRDHIALDRVSLSIEKGKFIVILGPSGAGKSTLLKIIAGFEKPDSGKVYLEGEDVTNKPPYKRNVNTVFQNYALFPHMTVFDNVAFGLRMKGYSRDEIARKVKWALDLVNMGSHINKYPTQLSGGEQQRVALARALVNEPPVLLLDEPLGQLDLKLRRRMQRELKDLQRKLGSTFIHVTHDQEEAMSMADIIVVMNRGKILQVGTPEEIYENPSSGFVADFIGEANILKGVVRDIDRDSITIETDRGFSIRADRSGKDIDVGSNIIIAIRPEELALSRSEVPEGYKHIDGVVRDYIFMGSFVDCYIDTGSGELRVRLPKGEAFWIERRARVKVLYRPDRVRILSQ